MKTTWTNPKPKPGDYMVHIHANGSMKHFRGEKAMDESEKYAVAQAKIRGECDIYRFRGWQKGCVVRKDK